MEVDEFLEHHGVKGMRWGVRNDTSPRNGNYANGKPKPFSRHNPHQKRNLAIGATAVIGAFAASYMLQVHGENKWAAAQTRKVVEASARRKEVAAVIQRNAQLKLHDIHFAAETNKITPDQRNRLVALLSRDTSNAYKRADRAFDLAAYGLKR
jgi:hypothetical protein